MQEMPESIALLDALSKLKRQNQAMPSYDPQTLKKSLFFIVQHPKPRQVLECLLWLRGSHRLDLLSWLETPDGCAWLQTQERRQDLLRNLCRKFWALALWIKACLPGQRQHWREARGERNWLETTSRRIWLGTNSGRVWLNTQGEEDWQ
jgi:hypothetical protein